ncbi:MAG: hypothetical protein HXS40_04815 [Theionarchaea archaeon]|nr:hypothetical protein [Theionarchaea archaeon]
MILVVNLSISHGFQEYSKITYCSYVGSQIKGAVYDERVFQPHEDKNILVDENLTIECRHGGHYRELPLRP